MSNKIKIIVKNNDIIFSLYNRNINDENLNNTNIIDIKNLKFTSEYISNNLDLMSSFLNLIVLKNNITKLVITDLEVAPIIIKLSYNINIHRLIFTQDIELNYTISDALLKNSNLTYIECYSMPKVMFNRFNSSIVETRCKVPFTSNFMKYNNINTYSKLCNIDRIIIDSYLTKNDLDDIIYFFSVNRSVKRIIIKGYKRNNLIVFLQMIDKYKLKHIKIILVEDSLVLKDLTNDMELFTKLSKKYNVSIKIKYSDSYKNKNKFKELCIIIIKLTLLLLILVVIILMLFKKNTIKNDNKGIEDNLKIIDEVVSDNSNISDNTNSSSSNLYTSPYYTKYDNVYSKLKEINNDTVGWIKVKNTKVDYPVVQGSDNEYYLDHAFNKTKNGAGWIFADYRNNLDSLDDLDDNTIIYGHDIQKNFLMFGSLEFLLTDAWNSDLNNLDITFNIRGNDVIFKIFSVYTIDKTSDYLVTNFLNKEDYKKFILMIKNRSIKDFNVDIDVYSKILTLSTCYKTDSKRLVVHAKKM